MIYPQDLVDKLKALACLGNGNTPGNSEGNSIAISLLSQMSIVWQDNKWSDEATYEETLLDRIEKLEEEITNAYCLLESFPCSESAPNTLLEGIQNLISACKTETERADTLDSEAIQERDACCNNYQKEVTRALEIENMLRTLILAIYDKISIINLTKKSKQKLKLYSKLFGSLQTIADSFARSPMLEDPIDLNLNQLGKWITEKNDMNFL